MQSKQRFYRYLRLTSATTVAGIAAVAALDRAVFNDAPFRLATAISNVAFAAEDDAKTDAVPAEVPRKEQDAAFRALLDEETWQTTFPTGEITTRYSGAAFDVYSNLLATEETKTPVDVGRVLELRRRLAQMPPRQFSKESERQFFATVSDYPTSVQASYVRRLLETPENESGEFYLLRYNELRCAARATFLGEIASKEELRGRKAYVVENELREKLRAEADKIADRLPFADDLKPAARLEFFAAYVDRLVESGDVEKLRDLYDRESVRDADNPFDAVRAPLVDLAILRARLVRLNAEPDEQEAFELAYDVAERADDGEIAWELGGCWALEARTFFERFEEAGLLDVARRLKDDLVAAFDDSQDPTEQEVREELRRPVVNFDFSLLDVPEGESGEFYLERLRKLQAACADVLAFDAVRYNLVKYRDEKGLPHWRRAIPNSLENKVYVAARVLYERLFDAPDLAPEIRDRCFDEYLRDSYLLYRNASDEIARQDWRDFCAARLTLEETREPFPLARVLALRAKLSNAENQLARKESDAEKKTFADFPALAALTDDLAKKVELERLAAEAEAEVKAEIKIQAEAEAKAGTAQPSERALAAEERFFSALLLALKLYGALPDLLAEERPTEETTEFYRQRREELKLVTAEGYSPRRVLVAGFLAGKLAYAEDLAPVERFEAFQGYVAALGADIPRALGSDAETLSGVETPSGVERLTALLEQETKRKAEHPADAARVPYVRYCLLQDCLNRLPQPKSATTQSATPEPVALSEEDRAELRRVGAELLEVVDDGPLAWELGSKTWSGTAENVAGRVARYDVAFATQLRKDLVARLADADSEAERQARAGMTRAIRQAELLGSTPTVDGRLVDGTPFDWATYRGAPVLIEIFRSENAENAGRFESTTLGDRPLEDEAFFNACRDAGLKVVRYDAGKLRFVPSVAIPGLVWPQENDDWVARLGFGATSERVWILFDADGRVVATEPTPRVPNAPTLQKALEALYPNVDPKSGAKR